MDPSQQPEKSQRPTGDETHSAKNVPRSFMTDKHLIIVRELVWAMLFIVVPSVALSLVIGGYSFQITVATVIAYVAFRVRKRLARLFVHIRKRNTPRVQPKKPAAIQANNTVNAQQNNPDDAPTQVLPAQSQLTKDRFAHLEPQYSQLTELHRTLSNHSRKRIQKQLPKLDLDTFICEFRLPKIEFFFNLDTGKNHHRLIYGPAFLLLLSLVLFVASFIVPLHIPRIPWVGIAVKGGASILVIVAGILFWQRFESVFFKRVVIFQRHLVFVDSPPLFSGGGTLPYELRQVDKVNIVTIRPSLHQDDTRHRQSVTLKSSFADKIGLSWISADTQMQKDDPLPWFGPYRKTALLAAIIDAQKDWAKLDYTRTQQGAQEDVKEERRAERRSNTLA